MAVENWMQGQRFSGSVKSFRGSFGWLACSSVAEKLGGRDVFLHRNDLNSVPVVGDTVEFSLILDAKQQPKATKAIVLDSKKPDAPQRQGKETSSDMQVKRAALMLFRGSDVLILREQKDDALMWSDLGGKVEAGESYLQCAVRELDEEANGFLSEDSIALLKRGLSAQFGDGTQSPEIVALKASGNKPQAVAVFPLDCTGVDLELLAPGKPNSFGVHAMSWVSRHHPDLKDRSKTRWPLLRALCAMRGATSKQGRERSRSPRREA
mmetsp:Transcript_45330/g.105829  ORF Transcript_45330/g.105829 Transcript_45330/m.105829 type:complete len:266 (+) Transcript_45330:33-830(+)